MKNLRKLNKAAVFDILDSELSNRLLAEKHEIGRNTISQIRQGRTYREFYREYHNADAIERKVQLETLEEHPHTGFYYVDSNILRVSVDDLLISIDLRNGNTSSIKYNTRIKGKSVGYGLALKLLKKYGILR